MEDYTLTCRSEGDLGRGFPVRLVRVARMSWFRRASSKFRLRIMKVEGHVLLEMCGTSILCVCVQLLIHVWLFMAPWSIACQAPVPMKFSMQIPGWVTMPSSRDLPSQGLNPGLCVSCIGRWILSTCGSRGKESACNAGATGNTGLILGREDPLEKGIETHSSILAWRISWTEEPGGLQSVGS